LNTKTLNVTSEGAQQDLGRNDHVISNVPNPVNPQDAVNKLYAYEFFWKMVQQIACLGIYPKNNKSGRAKPTESRDAGTKHYVDQLFNNLRDLIRFMEKGSYVTAIGLVGTKGSKYITLV